MDKSKIINPIFQKGLEKLGFNIEDDSLFFSELSSQNEDPQIYFHVEKSKLDFSATAVYMRKQLNGSYKPQVYLYDFTDREFNSQHQEDLVLIQKKIWSSGEAPLACIFYKTEIKILNCSTHLKNKDYSPEHLIKDLKIVSEATLQHKLFNENFALKIKSGVFWDEEENRNRFKFQNSAYDKLIDNIRYIVEELRKKHSKVPVSLINKIIVQSILIKYLEERIDSNGDRLLTEKYFKRYDKSNSFIEVISKNKFVDLLIDLNKDFNGNVFKWTENEQSDLKKIDLSSLAILLDTRRTEPLRSKQIEIGFLDWRYFEFKYIPVELISRLYENFLSTDKKDEGIYYTPSHLAQLLVDESIPLRKFIEIDPYNFKILDPACGSGIFLVIAFKRLVQIWRLRNENKRPSPDELKKILLNVHGVDKKDQAISLASFSLSLALCNELHPLVILTKLRFDDLRQNNLIESDFFECENLINKKFKLIIGNPPFRVGALEKHLRIWNYDNEQIKIPQGQIALKFLSSSIVYLEESGLLCLIIKSSGLIYNSSSNNFKKFLFSKLNVIQILDFTALARNRAVWDNGADVAAATIFLKNEAPDYSKNILHLIFRRTKSTIERIFFEIDDYDLHFVNRNTARENNFIWKNNLLGGGRISSLVEKVKSHNSLNDYLEQNNSFLEEGFEIGNNGNFSPDFIYKIPFLPTEAINENAINYTQLRRIDKKVRFSKLPIQETFEAPNLIVWECVGENKFPIFFNKVSFSFKRRLISIKSRSNNIKILNNILKSFKSYFSFYKFYLFATSGETLINRNNTFLLKDLREIPFIEKLEFSTWENNIIEESITFFSDFYIHGERSKAVKRINQTELKPVITNYGQEFSYVLNLIYKDEKKNFRLSDVVSLSNSFIATIFKYDSSTNSPVFHQDNSKLNLPALSDFEISKYLTGNRIIKLYPAKDTIVFIKPNQYRYWLSLIAYRDADKCVSDLSKLGY